MNNDRPNIVMIITDQQRYDTIAALGYPYMNTPNLDRLVEEGVVFTQNFITAASCAPARASLFTGMYPHTTGIYKNADTWRHSWVEDLAEGGYHCVNIGKMHTYPFETPLGFHERFVVENKDRYLEGRFFFDRWDMSLQAQGLVKQQRELYRKLPEYKDSVGAFEWNLPEKTHSDFFVGDTATWWLDNKPDTQPFFMEIGFPGPHPPYDPIPRYIEEYMEKDFPLPDFDEESFKSHTKVQKELIEHNVEIDHDSVVWTKNPTKEQLKRLRAHYYANVTMIDEKIGQIIDKLDEKGYLENTVIIFTSDHGDCLGDHGHIQKWTMYDTITRSPMIVWNPNRFKGGRKIDRLSQQFDIAPVILELAQVECPKSWEAQSLMSDLKGEDSGDEIGREYVFAEQRRDGILTGAEMLTMIRSTEWKLVHHYGNGDEGELYHLTSDPEENRNLWFSADPQHAAQKEVLLRALLDWRIESGINAGDWTVPWR